VQKIILLASYGKNNGEIARTLDISLDMARLWRSRWFETSDKKVAYFFRDYKTWSVLGAPVKI